MSRPSAGKSSAEAAAAAAEAAASAAFLLLRLRFGAGALAASDSGSNTADFLLLRAFVSLAVVSAVVASAASTLEEVFLLTRLRFGLAVASTAISSSSSSSSSAASVSASLSSWLRSTPKDVSPAVISLNPLENSDSESCCGGHCSMPKACRSA